MNASPEVSAADQELATLRRLLGGGSDDERLAALEGRLGLLERERVERLSEDLPAAVKARAARDSALGRALGTPVERALKFSIARDPTPMVEAISPILGPAIRKAVAAALVGLLQSFNNALDHSLSPRALAWRVEAWRTGHSFAEVALLHSLIFRVEQLFLIHRENGLVLQHVVAPSIVANDADMVSGMLTAIQDFVRDSFGAQEGEGLEAMQVGALTVWVERGPQIALAAVIRGVAPNSLRGRLQDALAEIERRYGHLVAEFKGDPAPFEATRELVESCLDEQQRPRARYGGLLVFLGLLLLLLGGWALWSWLQPAPQAAPAAAPVPAADAPADPWAPYLARLDQLPGLVVVSAERRAERLTVRGLRDPLAPDPAAVLRDLGLEASRVEHRWTEFVSLAPELVLARAERTLHPPPGVELALEAGVLQVRGDAPIEWLAQARQLALAQPGVQAFDAGGERGDPWPAAVAAVEGAAIRFAAGRAEIGADQLGAVEEAFRALTDLDRAAVALGREADVEIVGHNDPSGTPAQNAALRLARADATLDALRKADLRRVRLRPVFKEGAESAGSEERTARFHVVVRSP